MGAAYEPKVPGFPKVPLNDLAAVEAAITPRTVAVMLEPIQGEAGVFEASDAFLRGLRALTQERGLLLILDEIQTGIGRTGKLFGFQHAGIAPGHHDVGQGLGGGVPLAALVAHRDVVLLRLRRSGRHVLRQSAHVRGRLRGDGGGHGAGIPGARGAVGGYHGGAAACRCRSGMAVARCVARVCCWRST